MSRPVYIYVVTDGASISWPFTSKRAAREEFAEWKRRGGDGRLTIWRFELDETYFGPAHDFGRGVYGTPWNRARKRS
jgi:hypothetical protein